ncbi:uncharacterized protein SPAPADRAFT_62668 [Spathaspora passalidarum NRRL Y-27907]|uniref:Uncharacterized protein n=1 Tax=Spathaspora passalidarum (strain NRRL Y-27907 / 11-Y1) TaxID=619300 RepID=G3AT36_SPAPN|nr:uncharacterized protein SPAPADRAFT_62668 [Spathaspora passalidarum NRRL Y-27907]EGW30799.1 hypothetical protein SPAPADRAFT_62668 [Spathaspora passalidarum NRRL Y-27907]
MVSPSSSPTQSTGTHKIIGAKSAGHTDNLRSSPPRSILEDIQQIQHDRSMKLLHPLSLSPIRAKEPERFQSHSLSSPLRKSSEPRNVKTINSRNKHDIMQKTRQQYVQEKLLLQRDKQSSQQFTQDLIRKYEEEYNQIMQGVDIDQLIEEEQNVNYADDESWEDEYQQELEELEFEEDLELVELLHSLELNEQASDH